MKRKLSILLAVVLTISLFVTGTVHAADSCLYDEAELLTASEEQELSSYAQDLTETYACDTVIVTVNSLLGMDIETYAEWFFHDRALGYGDDRSCVMLLIGMDERSYDILAHGYGNTVFTDYGKDVMADRFVGYLSDGDYYGGFYSFLTSCESYYEAAANGEAFDVDTDYEGNSMPLAARVLISLLIAAVIALIVCQILKSQLKTAKAQTTAGNYVTNGGLNLSVRTDLFLRRNRSRRHIPKSNSTGGGGTSINSGGFSHRSGKF